MKKAVVALLLCTLFFVPYSIALTKAEHPFAYVPHTVTSENETEAETEVTEPLVQEITPASDYTSASQFLSKVQGVPVPESVVASLSNQQIVELYDKALKGKISTADWLSITGATLNTLIARTGGEVDGVHTIDLGSNSKSGFEIGFVGDINFNEGSYVMPHSYEMPGGVTDCIADEFLKEMRAVDIMLANNEFTYSDRGTPTAGKQYTFRAKPESVQWLDKLGIDIVSLANNHTYDWGRDSFIDTLSTLSGAGMPYVGAGMDFNEAARPVSFLINGYKVSFLSASRAENYRLTPGAEKDSPGIMETYDDTKQGFIDDIKTVSSQSDITLVYVHWGTEYTTELTKAQLELGKAYVDAGATAVIGAHTHCLQGMEFYGDAPIVYSLGNFWFNTKDLDTGMIKLYFENGEIKMTFIPGRQVDSEVKYLTSQEDRRKLYDRLISVSPNKAISIDDNGVVTPRH